MSAGKRRDAILAADCGRAVRATKNLFLQYSTVDGTGGQSTTGARYWFVYTVHVLGITPFQPPDASIELRRMYEEYLEDMGCWAVEYKPFGNDVSIETAGKYCSQARSWYFRKFHAVLGLGAANSRISIF